MGKYLKLDEDIERKIIADRHAGVFYGTPDSAAVRLVDKPSDKATLLRPPFTRDIGKIINLPIYSRLQDKTQVLSLYKNDDISHRMLHVQFVSRIARDISRALGLNVDLTEAIALGHDLGHTPFGHAGERMLDGICQKYGIRFDHNVQSVRALTVIYPRNVTLQTLDGILCHNGELEASHYAPAPLQGFDVLFSRVEECERKGASAIKLLVPQTVEGCVVRISDIIAYIGKDRQDAQKLGLVDGDDFKYNATNSELINNITVDIVNNSYGKGFISMSDGIYALLSAVKTENYDMIYRSEKVHAVYEDIAPKFERLFECILSDIKHGGGFTQRYFIDPIIRYNPEYARQPFYRIACDFIASMTDDFCIAAYEYLTKEKFGIGYKDYFE